MTKSRPTPEFKGSVSESDTIRNELDGLHALPHMSWRKISRKLYKERGIKIPAGSLCTFVKDGTLADEHKLKLGIPLDMKPAPVCTNPACESYGEPHTWDCRTQTVKAKAKPRKKAHQFGWTLSLMSDNEVREMVGIE